MKKCAWLIFLTVGLITCGKKDPAPQQAQCLLTGYSNSGSFTTGAAYTYTGTQTITYNSQDLIAGSDNTTLEQFANGNKVTTSAKRTYEYDANGFMTSQTDQFSSDAGGSFLSTDTYNYEYANNLLTKSTHSNTTLNTGVTSSFTTTEIYQYNNAGKIVQMSSTTSGAAGNLSFSVLYEYTNGVLSKITEDDGGGPSSGEVEVNAQGLITKIVYPTSENHYQYNEEGNLLKLESWQSNKKSSTITYEYDTNPGITRLIFPPQKGVSQLNLYGNTNTHNITKLTQYDGSDVITNQTVYTYTYNSHGYPNTESYTSAGAQSTFTFSYKDCD